MTTRTKHALITGGSRGIGLAIAQLLAKNNYRITLLSRNEPTLQEALKTLDGHVQSSLVSSPHTYIAGDISKPQFWTPDGIGKHLSLEEGKKTSDTIVEDKDRGRFDVLVNCAGLSQRKMFVSTDSHTIQDIVDTNLTSLMAGTRYLLRKRCIMGRWRQGKEDSDAETVTKEATAPMHTPVIINVASLLGLKGGHGAVAYAASKAGVLGFTRALAAELGLFGVRVNAIVPGYIETDMTKDLDVAGLEKSIPLKRFGRPEEVASAALFLAQNEYAHNCVINIDGGLSAM